MEPQDAAGQHKGGMEPCTFFDLQFSSSWTHLVVVLPAAGERQAHEDGFDAASCLQPEGGASVVHQVELHIPGGKASVEWTDSQMTNAHGFTCCVLYDCVALRSLRRFLHLHLGPCAAACFGQGTQLPRRRATHGAGSRLLAHLRCSPAACRLSQRPLWSRCRRSGGAVPHKRRPTLRPGTSPNRAPNKQRGLQRQGTVPGRGKHPKPPGRTKRSAPADRCVYMYIYIIW